MRRAPKIISIVLAAIAGLALLGILTVGGVYLYVAPSLPSVGVLKDIHLQVPLRVYTRDGRLMAEFGNKRRVPLAYDQVPKRVIQAFISAEDERFFEHSGVDFKAILRAAISLALTGKKEQGGGTITMQVARNFFLTRQKTYSRKIREIFLALRIDRELTKKDILDLYLNKIYLGEGAYGIGAAARVYYGSDVAHLTLAQIAMIAGLPRAPSADNPLASPKRALARRAYVLGRMHVHGYIGDAAYKRAMQAPVTATYHSPTITVHAPYVAEMVRRRMVHRFGKDAYTAGYSVFTTLDSRLEPLAQKALRKGLEAYTRRHGFRGAAAHIALPTAGNPAAWEKLLTHSPVGMLDPALVLKVHGRKARVYVKSVGVVTLSWEGMKWARPYIDANHEGPRPQQASDILKPGDVVYVEHVKHGKHGKQSTWMLGQLPKVQGALVSLDPFDGALVALAGGFDFHLSKFNRATQAVRQPGSSFKPFVYSAALEDGFTPATVVDDTPVVVANRSLDAVWRPQNYAGRFNGPTRLRVALAHSLNLVSVRILQRIGIPYAVNYLKRFGFRANKLPHNLTLALGSASVTPMQMARGYAVFANGGRLIGPYLIERVLSSQGKVVYQAHPALACVACQRGGAAAARGGKSAGKSSARVAARKTPGGGRAARQPGHRGGAHQKAASAAVPSMRKPERARAPRSVRIARQAITPQNAYMIRDMMRDVIRHGTGRRARALGRTDLAGKTGTTNNFSDAWFGGFNPNLVTVAWVGFDKLQTLGRYEEGAHAALPVWINFMGPALAGVPNQPDPAPNGIVTVRIDSVTGLLAGAGDPNAMFEIFRVGHLPPKGFTVGRHGKKKKKKDNSLF
jgi:penicillin-binding protein 1A